MDKEEVQTDTHELGKDLANAARPGADPSRVVMPLAEERKVGNWMTRAI